MYARWVEEAGARVGVRVATVAERVRSTGREGYLRALGLSPRQLFDVVGNHFDPDAVILRMFGALREWADGARYRCDVPDPAALLGGYGQVRTWVVRQQEQQWLAGGEGGAGRVPVAHPFPEDLREWLLTEPAVGAGVVGGAGSGDPATNEPVDTMRVAAEDGRGRE